MPAREFIKFHVSRDILARLFSKIEKSTEYFYNGSACWIWTAFKDDNGYGHCTVNGLGWVSHRILYHIFVETIPPELDCDHLCRRPFCVNPAHIEPVTNYVNTMRGENMTAINARKTHCPKGHDYALYTRKKKKGRDCLICHRERERERKARIVA